MQAPSYPKLNPQQIALVSALLFSLLYLWAIVSYVQFSEFGCLLLIAAMGVCLLVAVVVSVWQRSFRSSAQFGAILLFLLAATAFQFRFRDMLRPECRWLLRSSNYKTQVFAQARGQAGKLPHLEWDGWGFAGSDTSVYLVYDSADALNRTGHPGLPCPVWSIHRLEKHWYSVVFYTDQNWDSCS